MNFVHLKYAVEVAHSGSINKAAERLYLGQPNLSRAIKELEASLGVVIFDRSAKGMQLTPDGQVFIQYAESILKQVEALKELFDKNTPRRKRFSISVPRASYIADAFARFSRDVDGQADIELYYKETNSMRTLKNILQEDYKLGIIRYAQGYHAYYQSMMQEKNLAFEKIAEFEYVLLMSRHSPLAGKEKIPPGELREYTEIAHADPFVPSIPLDEVKKQELQSDVRRRIFVFERASQFELLSQNPNTFMWASPVPCELLSRYGLVQKSSGESGKIYQDMLLHRKDYQPSELDRLFISQLLKAKQEAFSFYQQEREREGELR